MGVRRHAGRAASASSAHPSEPARQTKQQPKKETKQRTNKHTRARASARAHTQTNETTGSKVPKKRTTDRLPARRELGGGTLWVLRGLRMVAREPVAAPGALYRALDRQRGAVGGHRRDALGEDDLPLHKLRAVPPFGRRRVPDVPLPCHITRLASSGLAGR